MNNKIAALKFENRAITAFLDETKEQFEEERFVGPVVADAWKQIGDIVSEPDSGIVSGGDELDASAAAGDATIEAMDAEYAFGKRRGRAKVEHSRVIGRLASAVEVDDVSSIICSGSAPPAPKRGKKK